MGYNKRILIRDSDHNKAGIRFTVFTALLMIIILMVSGCSTVSGESENNINTAAEEPAVQSGNLEISVRTDKKGDYLHPGKANISWDLPWILRPKLLVTLRIRRYYGISL